MVATEFHTKSALGSTIESIMSLIVAVGRYSSGSSAGFDAHAASISSRKPENMNGFISVFSSNGARALYCACGSMQLGVFRLRLLENRDVGIGVLPEREEILVRSFRLGLIS